jgi:O-methyltransferase domain
MVQNTGSASETMPKSHRDGGAFAEMALFVRSFQISKMLQIAATLELADRIKDEAKPAGELARECGADPAMLLRLCRALAAFGIFAVDAGGIVSQTARSAFLCRDAKPTLHHAVRYWMMPSTWAVWGNLEHAVRNGKVAFETTFGMPVFEYLKAHPEEAELFDNFMQHSPDDRHAAVVEAYDFSDVRVVADVGGGNGALLAAILAASPGARGLLFDQDAVVAGASAVLGSYASRCTVQPGDFFQSVPAGGDVYTLSQILHDWSDERCLQILANCRAAMGRGARLLVIERVLDDRPGQTIPMNFLADMHMMAMFPEAKERTPAEFGRLFRETGFGEPRLIPTRSPYCIIETRPAG